MHNCSVCYPPELARLKEPLIGYEISCPVAAVEAVADPAKVARHAGAAVLGPSCVWPWCSRVPCRHVGAPPQGRGPSALAARPEDQSVSTAVVLWTLSLWTRTRSKRCVAAERSRCSIKRHRDLQTGKSWTENGVDQGVLAEFAALTTTCIA